MFNVSFGITADPGLQRPQGSSFATAWVLLALSEMQHHELIADRALNAELAVYERELEGTDRAFLAALPVTYAQVPKPNDSDSSGYALAYEPITSHGAGAAAAQARSGRQNQAAASKDAAAAGVRIDSVASLKLPWMIINAQAAYPSGSYRARVWAHQFVD